MKRMNQMVLVLGIILLSMGMVCADAASTMASLVNAILCKIILVLWAVAAAIATIVVVIAGIKWIGSSEDAGARAQAKSTIVHAVIGLIIVIVALTLVNFVVSGSVNPFSCA